MSNKTVYFTDSHEWIAYDHSGRAVVGISSYAKQELGEIVAVQLPNLGQIVSVGQEVCVLESTKAAADVYAPVSGKVIAVNESLRGDSHMLNQAPESDGWLFQVELSNPSELDRLLSILEYRNLVGCESDNQL